MSAVAWRDELAAARAVAAERRKAWEEAPELSVEEILESFKRELRSVSVPYFGRVYYYHPMSVAERVDLESKIDSAGGATAANIAQAIIAVVRNSDGSQKFSAEHATALLDAPADAFMRLAESVIQSHRFTLVAAEKK